MTEIRNHKTNTDQHWNERARSHSNQRQVNIDDLVQRQLENDFILKQLEDGDKILEVGCGNGFLTQELRKHVNHVDAFDFAENMIASAGQLYGETNNRFFVDSVLSAKKIQSPYDKIVCVRVLINLQNTDEQKLAIRNMAGWLKPGGTLILIEGYQDGFEALNRLRNECGVAPLKPASINFYSHFAEVESEIDRHFTTNADWHSGMFDVLTRVVFPLTVGAGKAIGPSEFHDEILPLARALNPDSFKQFGRLRGLALQKR